MRWWRHCFSGAIVKIVFIGASSFVCASLLVRAREPIDVLHPYSSSSSNYSVCFNSFLRIHFLGNWNGRRIIIVGFIASCMVCMNVRGCRLATVHLHTHLPSIEQNSNKIHDTKKKMRKYASIIGSAVTKSTKKKYKEIELKREDEWREWSVRSLEKIFSV